MNAKVLIALLVALIASALASTTVDHNVLSVLSSINYDRQEVNTLLVLPVPEYQAAEQDYSAHQTLSTLAAALNNNQEEAQVLNRADDTNALLAQLAASLAQTQTSKAQGDADHNMLSSLAAILGQGGVQSISAQEKHKLEASLTNLETELQNKEAVLQRQLAENTLSTPEYNDHEILSILADAQKAEYIPEEHHQTLTAETLMNDQLLSREVDDWKRVLAKKEQAEVHQSPEDHEVLTILAEAEKVEHEEAGSAEVLGAGYATSEESESTVAPTTQEESGESVMSYFATGLAYLFGRKN